MAWRLFSSLRSENPWPAECTRHTKLALLSWVAGCGPHRPTLCCICTSFTCTVRMRSGLNFALCLNVPCKRLTRLKKDASGLCKTLIVHHKISSIQYRNFSLRCLLRQLSQPYKPLVCFSVDHSEFFKFWLQNNFKLAYINSPSEESTSQERTKQP